MIQVSLGPRQYNKAVGSLGSGIMQRAFPRTKRDLGLRRAVPLRGHVLSSHHREDLSHHGPGLIATHHRTDTIVFLRHAS